MTAVSGLAAILFFGGWNGPLPVTEWLGLTAAYGPVAAWAGDLLGSIELSLQGLRGRDRDDVVPLDPAAAADRPGDDRLPEVLHPACRRDVRGGRPLDVPSCPAACCCTRGSGKVGEGTVIETENRGPLSGRGLG